MKVVQIVQARMGSTRLKNKVLLPILGKPMLQVVIERSLGAKRVNELVIATTILPQDDPIVTLAQAQHLAFFRGSENDVLDRFYQAGLKHKADLIVRTTGDNPFAERDFIDWAIDEHLKADADHTDTWTDTLPLGLRVEVIRFSALAKAWREDNNMAWREHITPYIINHPELFKQHKLGCDVNYGSLRWSVDTPDDYAMTCQTFEHFDNLDFSWRQAAEWLMLHPEVARINQGVQQKTFMFNKK
jgi:spore coat polysaccharide biosynthesis protein SpsF